jgi:hypothetical protein
MGNKYQSPYDPGDPYNGLPVTIEGEDVIKNTDGSTSAVLIVRFPSGHTATAWPEEIIEEGS